MTKRINLINKYFHRSVFDLQDLIAVKMYDCVQDLNG